MEIVRTWQQIKDNLDTLERYRYSSDPEESEFYRDMIRRGRCFVVHQQGDTLRFGPSRFVGYIDNSRQKHLDNPHKDGKETNPEISRILGYSNTENRMLEQEHNRLCRDLGVVPYNVRRSYWLVTRN